MDTDEKRLLLAKSLEEFRSWTYESLAKEIDRTRREHECLQYRQGVFADGTEYKLEFNVFWDDRRDGDVRVCGDLTTNPQRPLLGFLPIFAPDVTDSFIMRYDGTLVDE
jgi:hypothetical protein